jgi:hypothetical protein
MKRRRLIAGFEIGTGALMILMWGFFFVAGMIPELQTKPVEIALHLIAEAATAVTLLVGGVGLWKGRPYGIKVSLVGLGMLAYTLLVSPGYYLSQGVWAAGLGFFVMLMLDLACLIALWNEKTLEQS